MARALFVLLMFFSALACADEHISVCYNYGCTAEAPVRYSETQLGLVKRMLLAAKSPVLERKILATVIGKLYRWAGQQTPIYADRGGNVADEGARGAMDCIDHTTTTTRFLNMLVQRRALRYHRVIEPVRRSRYFIFEHVSAAIEESPARWLPRRVPYLVPEAPGEIRPDRFAVDSWFVDNGEPVVILPLDEWIDGGGPEVGN